MSSFWSFWIIGLTLTNLALLLWVLLANRKVAVKDDESEDRTTGHVYDGIEEFDNPLPKWWFMLFIVTFVFTAIYLVIYPGLGNWKGIKGWTAVKQLEQQQASAVKDYEKSYGVFNDMSVEVLSQDPKAMKMATRLFSNNCAVCHGADGGGNLGFPNLTDHDWLYGGTPEAIKTTLIGGRNAQMPAWSDTLGEEKIGEVAQYVLSLSGREERPELVADGKELFAANCAVCHGADGKGQHALGAPNLTDDIWLYGGEPSQIRQTLRHGRNGVMPAQGEKLRDDKIHLLTAYVYSLSQDN